VIGGGYEARYRHLADEDLMAVVEGGDADAFAALYDRHCRAAYYFSYRVMGDRQAAEDLTQDAFLKVWRSAGGYRPERGSVRTWILSIIHNRGIDLLRYYASRRRTRNEARAEAPRGQPSEDFAEAWRNHQRGRVREALQDLPHAQREVLALVHLAGLTQMEVSERLCLPLGTVKGRVRLGLQKLRGHPKIQGMAVG
jgi:RNA polymerase sigma-70 factor (ECF subfamily)